jgi:uncharacterized protein (TIGR02147 family)
MPRKPPPPPPVVPLDFLSSDDYRAVLLDWKTRNKISLRRLCQKTGVPSPGYLSNMLNRKVDLPVARVPTLCRLMKLDTYSARIFYALVAYEEVEKALLRAELEREHASAVARTKPSIITRSRATAEQDNVTRLEQELERLKREVITARLLSRALPAEALGYRYLSSWAPPAIFAAARCAWFRPDAAFLARQFGGAMTEEQAADALEILFESGALTLVENGSVQVRDSPVVTSSKVESSLVRGYYEGIALFSARRNRELFDDPKGRLGEGSRLGALTIALPAVAIQQAAEVFIDCHKRLLELLERTRDYPSTEVYQLYLHLFPLTDPDLTSWSSAPPIADNLAETAPPAEPPPPEDEEGG